MRQRRRRNLIPYHLRRCYCCRNRLPGTLAVILSGFMDQQQPNQSLGPGPDQSSRRDPIYERWRWQIFSITWLAYAGFYLTRKAFSVAKNELQKPEVMGMARGDMAWI